MMRTLQSRINKGTKKLRNRIYSRLVPWEELNVVFIVSTGRTGTEFLANFFNKHFKQTIAYHEPAPDLFDLGVESIRKNFTEKETANRIKQARAPLLKPLNKNDIYVESNNNLVLLLPTVIKLFPKAKFVHVIRDSKTYLRSAYSKTHGKGNYTLFGENDPRKRLTAKDDIHDPFHLKWDSFSQFQKICWHWFKYNLLIERALANHPKKIVINYEQLFEHPTGETIQNLINFLELDTRLDAGIDKAVNSFSVKMNQSHRYKLGAFEEWSEMYKDEFYSVLG